MRLPWQPDRQEALHALRALDAIADLCNGEGESIEIYNASGLWCIKFNAAWTGWQSRMHGEATLHGALISVQRIKQQWRSKQ